MHVERLYCYYGAAVGLKPGMIPERFLPQPERPAHETALLVQTPKGCSSLFRREVVG